MRREPGARPSPAVGRMIAMAPNALTLLGLCGGATAIRFALARNWPVALEALGVAACFDMLDGRVARWLGAASDFGAQLDSLADLVSFGLAPPLIVYVWALDYTAEGWPFALLFAACCAVRLARFNVQRGQEHALKPTRYFTGLPAPGAAGLVLLPLMLTLQSSNAVFREPAVNMFTMVVVSALMVSKLPTLSIKHISIRGARRPAVIVAGLGVLAASFRWPWTIASAGWLAYALTVPASVVSRVLKRSGIRIELRRTRR